MQDKTSDKNQFTKRQVHRRLAFKLPVPVVADNGGEGGELVGYAKNISAGGLFIKTTSPLQPGETIKMLLDVPGAKISLRCAGEVVWIRHKDPYSPYDSGMGIRFLNLEPRLQAIIENYVRENLR